MFGFPNCFCLFYLTALFGGFGGTPCFSCFDLTARSKLFVPKKVDGAAAVVEGAAIVAPPLLSFGRSLEQVPLTTQLPDTKTAILCFHPGCFYLNLN